MVLADANPGIGGLGAATQLTLEEFREMPEEIAAPPAADSPEPAPEPSGPDEER